MGVWLLAVTWEAKHQTGRHTTPRRLVWVVDRRAVVDQATVEAESLVKKTSECSELRDTLSGLCVRGGAEPVLAVSTLRGEFADNREWSRDPLRPSIIVGTVDMVGSRLLFSGYGDSIRRRALHAGLLGNDALIVNDEAHLTPAFAALLSRVREMSGAQSMLLSATPRGDGPATFPETMENDLANPVFEKRYRAVKRLHLCEHEEPKKELMRLASEPAGRTLVFTRSPEDARKIAAHIESKHDGAQPALLTGTQRGWERDQLSKNEVIGRFRSKETPDITSPCWFVATSAGEVGIDLSSDRLVTDLDTADHLLQRFGRLNRFGETEGDAYVVYSPKQLLGEKAQRLRATLDYLRTLPDVSPEHLRSQPPPPEALSPAPSFAPILPWHVDVWSMTSLSNKDWPSRPDVEHWLRGEDEETSPPETYVAWREDIVDLAKPGIARSDLEEVFERYPVIAQERLKAYSRGLLDSLKSSEYLDRLAILLGSDGEIYRGSLGDLIDDERRLHYATLVLPPGIGYLDPNGMVDWLKPPGKLTATDHYDKSSTNYRIHRKFASDQQETDLPGFRKRYAVRTASDDETDEGALWVYYVAERVRSAPNSGKELLEVHKERAAKAAVDIARRAGMSEGTIKVFEWAALWHDAGKRRDLWQRAAGNKDGSAPLAKTEFLNPRALDGYRHELGSLIDGEDNLPNDFTSDEKDLARHLIASHHGWARPHFPERAFDKQGYRVSRQIAIETARRFARLQRQHGAWRLAYLETLFRSADAIVSSGATEFANA